MSEQAKTGQSSVVAAAPLGFWKMSGAQKGRHLLKVVLFFCTFGFAFPNVLEDF